MMLPLQILQYRSFTVWFYSALIAWQGKVEEAGTVSFAYVKVLDPLISVFRRLQKKTPDWSWIHIRKLSLVTQV